MQNSPNSPSSSEIRMMIVWLSPTSAQVKALGYIE